MLGLGEDDTTSEHVAVEEIDEILDEIDAILEENAKDYVPHYVQRSGQRT